MTHFLRPLYSRRNFALCLFLNRALTLLPGNRRQLIWPKRSLSASVMDGCV